MNQEEEEKEKEKEKEIEVLINTCYGGWSISKKAKKIYESRKQTEIDFWFEHSIKIRTDPLLIEIFKELGDEFNGKHSNIEIEKISKKYDGYFYIHEYDGTETIEINYAKYELNTLKNNINTILDNNNLTNDAKYSQIKELTIL